MNKYGQPEIFNANHGCQFTSLEFTGLLKDNGIQISMGGRLLASQRVRGAALEVRQI